MRLLPIFLEQLIKITLCSIELLILFALMKQTETEHTEALMLDYAVIMLMSSIIRNDKRINAS
jgi:hypothetical protein